MQRSFFASLLIAFATLTVSFSAFAEDINEIQSGNSKRAVAVDMGEVHATDYYQHQRQCTTVPRFADQVTPVGATSGDPEKDTFAYPVKSVDTVCASSQTQR